MKTTRLVSVVLTLVSVLDASNPNKKKRITRAKQPISATSLSSETQPALRTFTHRLLDQQQINGISILASNKPFENGYDSESSLKSMSDREEEYTDVQIQGKKKRKRASKAKAAVGSNLEGAEGVTISALMSMRSGSSDAVSIGNGDEPAKKPTKKAPKEVKVPELKKMTDQLFNTQRAHRFDLYFDGTNFNTEGTAFLARCFNESEYYALAYFLILNGARLPLTEDVINAMVIAKNETNTVARDILVALIRVDPVGSAQLFAEAAKKDESFDIFFLDLLYNEDETSVYFKTSDQLFEAFEIFAKSGNMPQTLINIIEDKAIEFMVMAIEGGKAELIELFLEGKWIQAEDQVVINDNSFTVICQLFGRIGSKRIIDLIKKHSYNMNYTHNAEMNPNGDILVAALAGKDLESFKRLLLLDASLDVKFVLKNGASIALRDYAASKRPDIQAIIQSFDEGTLQAEVDAEDQQTVMESIVASTTAPTSAASAALLERIANVDSLMKDDA